MSADAVYCVLRITKVTATHWPSEAIGPYRRTLNGAKRAAEEHADLIGDDAYWLVVGEHRWRLEMPDGYYEILEIEVQD